ncbi:bifunctional lysylphosphatidylglycerol flippase/synthetase MprF [Sphingomonas quercus]|uniref:Bifunctional lysylphosphatidylglycerol flippase/synthetase MprF n=1 Tax=Sphingomonas quercus TaxID=2842451 RepID=A0ABS6BLZ1_9SPHN|nr:bifunctional lysylphosphatidylglycerol flippase/synthetase MprF [Sphingomonas quercus]MBU3079337.1 bifunctional lysylphosphatidylglycerol flippase/synthetase MprF [Sphingomonas quercus]
MAEVLGLLRRYRTLLSIALVAAMIGLGFTALHQLTERLSLHDVRAAFHAIAPGQVLLAFALTAASYLALTLYDALALRIIGRPLPWRTAALASFTSYTISHNLGLSPITGGSARYRIYSSAGLDAGEVARIVVIASATFWMGVLAVTGAALAGHQGPLSLAGLALGADAAHVTGLAIIAATAALVLFCALGPGEARLFGVRLPLPGAAQAAAQIAIAAIDLACAAAALFVLIRGAAPALLPTFILAYALGIIAALVTHVPGGLGVFEAVVIATVPADRPALAAALIAYRLIYYVVPLALGIAALGLHEGRERRLARAIAGVRVVANGIAPLLMSAAAFLSGTLLLLSGSTPGVPARLKDLHSILPLPFIEASHLAASLAGTCLLLLAPGLYRRLDGAFVSARALLLAGAIFSLAKGIDYEEAIMCLAVAGLLQWTSPAFYRTTAFTARAFTPVWFACVTAVGALSLWVGLFSYKHVLYQNSLWWDFALHGDASRYLRASLGAAVVLAGAALWRLFAPAAPRARATALPQPLLAVLDTAGRTDAMLALTGDKRFLFSPAGDAFLMYQIRGSSWIVMADPVGPREAWAGLMWTIRSMAYAAQGRLMLYQISSDMLEIAIALGLQLVKYGEEAIVDVQHFRLEGPAMRSIRHTVRRAEREGASFAVVPAAEVPAILPALAALSGEWLEAKGQREKGFSLGQFDPDYVARFDCALVRVDGRIVAFANVWKTANRRELSVDLMRHGAGSPPGVMDFLFASLILWGKDQGYARFSLGLAPLSGMEAHRLSPLWVKAAATIFRHGERFYGFRGLRAYKEKFAPSWEPRYIAAPRGLGLVRALHDLNRLIGNPRSLDTPLDEEGIIAGPAAAPPHPTTPLLAA